MRPETPGLPGEFPFTRGIHPEMYRARLWTMRQYAGFGTAEQSNLRYRYLLSQGAKGLSVAFDLPTQLGMDSDHPLARGEVGRTGVAVCSLADMERLFEGIPLDRVSTSMTINATAPVLVAFYVLTARNQGVEPGKLAGTVQNDVLKEFVARGAYIYPPEPSMRLAADLIAWANRELPAWNPISVSGYHIREAGSTASQEVAFTLAHAAAYLEAAVAAGVAVDSAAPRFSFFFSAHSDFIEEIAKFRAARRLWARMVKQRFGAREPRAMMLRFHAQTAGSTLTAQQPDVNLARVAVQCLAAVFGGTQSLHANARDEALALPTEESARLAVRTQQIIAAETGVARTADPAGGARAVEEATARIEQEAEDYIRRIDEMGGALAAIESGYIQRQIENSAYRQQLEIESGERVIVGVNRYREAEEVPIPSFRLDPAVEEAQIARLGQLRASRSASQLDLRLSELERAARGGANLMPFILDSAAALATVGEISDRLRRVFGEYRAA